MSDEEVVFLSLLIVESELVKSKRKLEASVPNLSELLKAIGKELGCAEDADLVLCDAKKTELAEDTVRGRDVTRAAWAELLHRPAAGVGQHGAGCRSAAAPLTPLLRAAIRNAHRSALLLRAAAPP
jgi:hypothetical protein